MASNLINLNEQGTFVLEKDILALAETKSFLNIFSCDTLA